MANGSVPERLNELTGHQAGIAVPRHRTKEAGELFPISLPLFNADTLAKSPDLVHSLRITIAIPKTGQ